MCTLLDIRYDREKNVVIRVNKQISCPCIWVLACMFELPVLSSGLSMFFQFMCGANFIDFLTQLNNKPIVSIVKTNLTIDALLT